MIYSYFVFMLYLWFDFFCTGILKKRKVYARISVNNKSN